MVVVVAMAAAEEVAAAAVAATAAAVADTVAVAAAGMATAIADRDATRPSIALGFESSMPLAEIPSRLSMLFTAFRGTEIALRVAR